MAQFELTPEELAAITRETAKFAREHDPEQYADLMMEQDCYQEVLEAALSTERYEQIAFYLDNEAEEIPGPIVGAAMAAGEREVYGTTLDEYEETSEGGSFAEWVEKHRP